MKKIKNIIILGKSGLAKNLKNSLSDYDKNLKFLGYLGKSKKSTSIEKNLNKKKNKFYFVNGIGNFSNLKYENIFKKYINKKFKFLTLINKSAKIYKNCTIGNGSIVCENVLLKSNVKIGKFCLINSRALISHDTKIGDYSSISLNVLIAGNCAIGRNTFIGMGSKIINNIKIGNNVIVGAGSIITKNIPNNTKVYGNPIKIIKR